jgi:signal transduction histidine kinase
MGETVCPFGIHISYLRTQVAPKPIYFFLLTGFVLDAAKSETIRYFPRKTKRAIKNALKTTSPFFFCSTNEVTKLNLMNRALQTILAGRVAASMRNITHHLLTPVQGAMNDIDVIERGDKSAYPRLKSNINEIGSIAKQIHILLSENIEPTSQTIRRVNVHVVIREICQQLRSIADRRDMNFQNKTNRGYQTVEAVPDHLKIAFKCLLENAVKYSFTSSPGNTRAIKIDYATLSVSGSDNKLLRITIKNEGCPITKEEIDGRYLFELGYRGEYSADRGRQGTGSGLCIAQQIVQAHHGDIKIASVYNPDALSIPAQNSFTIDWPLTFNEKKVISI